jgi:transmembrane sensor
MNGADERISQQAADWHVASALDDMDWDGFTMWLEADPRHRSVYEEIALSDALLSDRREQLPLAVEKAEPEALHRWRLWIGGALAASLAAVIVIPQLTAPAPQTFTSEDASRAIALRGGSQVFLAPHSRLTIGGRHAEELALDGGALFTIRHDPNRTLSIAAGGLEIVDVGTRFDVQTGGDDVRVEVSDGEVELRGDALGKPVRLPAGRRILFDPAHGVATVAAVSARDVGEWREGRLTYDATPLSLVAADLSRYAGVTVTVSPPLAGRRFSGTLSIHDGETAVRDLAQLMGLQVSRRGGAYRLTLDR